LFYLKFHVLLLSGAFLEVNNPPVLARSPQLPPQSRGDISAAATALPVLARMRAMSIKIELQHGSSLYIFAVLPHPLCTVVCLFFSSAIRNLHDKIVESAARVAKARRRPSLDCTFALSKPVGF
jgi:hypothetical protein